MRRASPVAWMSMISAARASNWASSAGTNGCGSIGRAGRTPANARRDRRDRIGERPRARAEGGVLHAVVAQPSDVELGDQGLPSNANRSLSPSAWPFSDASRWPPNTMSLVDSRAPLEAYR
jgi:hypothetical protein